MMMESIAEDNGVIAVNIANGANRHEPPHEVLPRDFSPDITAQPQLNNHTMSTYPPERPLKKIKKGIFISYSPDAGFHERLFISDLVRQLKENNMADDIWFDKDENCIDSPIWFSQRMEAVEKCQAAIVILSDRYLTCPVSVYEGRTLFERQSTAPVKIFSILFSRLVETELPRYYESLLHDTVDLTRPEHCKLSVAEKTSVVLRSIMVSLEKFAVINTPLSVATEVEPDYNGEYKEKKICRWSVSNLQEWLFNLGVKEFYRQSLAENMVDGFLLMSMTDSDMINFLGIDSRIVRKKLMQNILSALDREQKLADNWHLRARAVRSRPNTVYLIYDPADVRLAQTFKADLIKKGLQVIHHQKLGQSKEEFLHLNGPFMATCSHVLLVLTEHATNSPFVFHETLFADWLGKKIIVSMFKNDWKGLRPSMKALLGECMSVDFEKNMYSEGMDVLEHHLRPFKSLPGVVLEQSYLERMAEGVKPLAQLAAESTELVAQSKRDSSPPVIFISFQWDMQSKVEEIRRTLEANNLVCWVDSGAHMRGHSSISSRSTAGITSSKIQSESSHMDNNSQRGMKSCSALICCITPKYLQSENCITDLKLADSLNKPVIAILLRFSSWPPEGSPPSVKRLLSKCTEVIEMYNDKLYRQNMTQLVDRTSRVLSGS